MTSEQSLDSFQVLCGQCHADKSKADGKVAEAMPNLGILRSHFIATTWVHCGVPKAALHGV